MAHKARLVHRVQTAFLPIRSPFRMASRAPKRNGSHRYREHLVKTAQTAIRGLWGLPARKVHRDQRAIQANKAPPAQMAHLALPVRKVHKVKLALLALKALKVPKVPRAKRLTSVPTATGGLAERIPACPPPEAAGKLCRVLQDHRGLPEKRERKETPAHRGQKGLKARKEYRVSQANKDRRAILVRKAFKANKGNKVCRVSKVFKDQPGRTEQTAFPRPFQLRKLMVGIESRSLMRMGQNRLM